MTVSKTRSFGFEIAFLALCGVLGTASLARAQTTPPSVVSGMVLTPTLDPTVPPAAPAVRLQYHTSSGIANVVLLFQSDITGNIVSVEYNAPKGSPMARNGNIVLQAPVEPAGEPDHSSPFYATSLGLYAASGTWSLVRGGITDQSGTSTEYDKSQLAAIFATPSFQVKNARQDITPPGLVSGEILTPTVSLSSAVPVFQTRLSVTDDRSGVAFVQLNLFPPGAAYPSTYISQTSRTIKSGDMFATALLTASDRVGTWGINSVSICDYAENCVFIPAGPTLTRMFGTTFTVTK